MSESERTVLKRYMGKVKQLNTEGMGFIISYNDNEDVLVSPSSFSDRDRNRSRTIQEGDRVEFSLKAIDVVPSGAQCYCCGRIGHYAAECSQKTNPRVRCYRCGIRGHYARDCFSADKHQGSSSSASVSASASASASLEREDDCDSKGIRPLVSVKNRRDVTRVEHFEDCFILDFDPTQIRDDHDDDDDDDDDECRSMVCVKKAEEVKKVEEVEDCFILDFDPSLPINFSNLSLSHKSIPLSSEQDVSILAEKGQVACRDYPHSRHICATHPFKSTPHELHCKMCYCYICDIPAPCKGWANIIGFQHCNATPALPFYRALRDQKKQDKG